MVHQPTFITKVARTCIDLVITNQPNLILSTEIHPSLHTNSHHQVNYTKVHLKCPPPPPYERRLWHYGRANIEAIQKSISDYDWENALGLLSHDPDLQVDHLDEVFLNVAKNFIPFEDKKIHPKDPPWITQALKSLYTNYKKKYKKFAKKNFPPDEKQQIDDLKSEYTTLVETEKDKYLKRLGNQVSNPKTGQKKYWSALKKLLNKNITSVIPPILQQNIFITDANEKCNIFNNYFKEQCRTIATSSTLPTLVRTTNLTLNSVNFSQNSIIEHIKKLNVNKAHGHDEISIRLIKMCNNAIAKPLFIIYKNCISKSYFPKKWKKANVVPVHKKNERNLVNNYRPISLLPIWGKLFEKIIFDNLYTYIFQNGFISDKQSGYRNGDSTIKQLLSITHEIYRAFDANEEVRAVFLDISRAFDRVWHEGLIHKLKKLGVDGDMINILTSFLANRMQRTTIDGKYSEWAEIRAGVPQGSILGPILFLIYINDIIEIIDSDVRIFADDTFIFRKADQHSSTALNRDLENITKWAFQWKMLFNPDISKQAIEVIFSNKNTKSVHSPLIFNGIPVKLADDTKHLGMTLDCKLLLNKHIDTKLAKARQGLGIMKQLKKWVSCTVLESIYKLYVRPHLDYGDMIYDVATPNKQSIFNQDNTNSLAKKVECIQYEAARIVTGAWKSTSRTKLYANLGWESLSDRRTLRKLCLLFETLQNNFPNYLIALINNQKFTASSRYYEKTLLKSIPCRINRFRSSFLPSVIEDWNKLEVEIKCSKSKVIFKNKLLNKARPKKCSYFGLRNNDKVRYITLLRLELSPLRAHKYRYNFEDTSDPLCVVCKATEDTKHYLLHCKSYRLTRVSLMQEVSSILGFNISTLPNGRIISILLYGSETLQAEKNLIILNHVTTFIEKSKRLDTF